MLQYLRENPSIALLAGLLLVTMSLMMRIAKRRRHSRANLSTSERTERLRQQHGLRGDLETLMVEIEQLAKRLGAQLDAKSIQLQRLLDQADHKLNQMRQAVDPPQRNPAASPDDNTGNVPPPARDDVIAPTDAAPENSDAAQDRLTRHVHQLADRGLDPLTIARELNEHVGKIELILALRKT